MPRVQSGFQESPRKADGKLVERLVDELKTGRGPGQPFIYETSFSAGKIKILVMWDEWKELPLEQRTNIILSAVEQSEGKDYRAKIARASGLTFPEAVAAGMLPYQITALRKEVPVNREQCREAMLAEGGSKLFGRTIQLRFPDEEAAEACKKRLIKRLPKSEDIWVITRVGSAPRWRFGLVLRRPSQRNTTS
jgi:hypothetical protein